MFLRGVGQNIGNGNGNNNYGLVNGIGNVRQPYIHLSCPRLSLTPCNHTGTSTCSFSVCCIACKTYKLEAPSLMSNLPQNAKQSNQSTLLRAAEMFLACRAISMVPGSLTSGTTMGKARLPRPFTISLSTRSGMSGYRRSKNEVPTHDGLVQEWEPWGCKWRRQRKFSGRPCVLCALLQCPYMPGAGFPDF